MKRRDFVKNSTLSAIGASFIAPLGALATNRVTHLTSEELTLLPVIK